MTRIDASESADLQACLLEAKAGSNPAVDQLFGRCRQYLLYIASRELDDDLRAKIGASDVVQESLVKAHRNFGEFQGQTQGELVGWLRQILIRTFMDAHRRYKLAQRRNVDQEAATDHPSALQCSTDTPSVQLMARERHEALERAMQRLPDEYQRVVRERIWDRRSFLEIAASMNRSPDAVRKLWFRGIEQLRKDWRAAHGGLQFD